MVVTSEDLADGDDRFRNGPIPKALFGLPRVAQSLQVARTLADEDASDDWQVGGHRFIESLLIVQHEAEILLRFEVCAVLTRSERLTRRPSPRRGSSPWFRASRSC